MSTKASNLDYDPLTTVDPSQLEAGLYEKVNTSQEQFNYDHPGLSHTTATTDGGTKEVRFEASERPSDDDGDEVSSPQQEHHGRKRAWSKAFDWVKDKQQDRATGTSDLRSPTCVHARWKDEAHLESSAEPTHEEGEDGKPLEQIYTKAAAETVSTFLRQDTLAAYPAETK